ncbi:MAG: hypothetical protein QQN41_06790 [Nitrosopumilus sp.]
MFKTIIVALIILFISQYFLMFVLEPMKELKQTISKIAVSIEYYANILYSINVASIEDSVEFKNEFRKLASLLRPQVDTIPFYDTFRFLFSLPNRSKLLDSTLDLIGLSNTTTQVPFESIEKRVNRIKQLLNIYMKMLYFFIISKI